MRLKELGATFIRLASKGWMQVGTLQEAQGLEMLCPGCWAKNDGPIGTHVVVAWFRDRGVPNEAIPGPGRWAVSGTRIEDLTLMPSLLFDCWHGFVRDGGVVNAP